MKLETHGLLTILKGATVLFAMVFDAGFVLGAYSNPRHIYSAGEREP